jgi:hypothetical protein
VAALRAGLSGNPRVTFSMGEAYQQAASPENGVTSGPRYNDTVVAPTAES